jgi:hypothetical protein
MRMVTKTAIREARLKEIKQEMLTSNKLKVGNRIQTRHLLMVSGMCMDYRCVYLMISDLL